MFYIGTSGWSYKGWASIFYPPDLPAREQLPYLSKHFPTVELNSSFYRLPAKSSFENWRQITPSGFKFSVKVPRTITHLKRLDDIESNWKVLVERAAVLGDKLAGYLLQFPPSLKAGEEMFGRIEKFMHIMRPDVRVAFELRHPTWFEGPQLEFFERNRICLVQADSSRYPHTPPDFSPGSWAYLRLHGPGELYASQYTDEDLSGWADLMKRELQSGKDVFTYFDNDVNGYAIQDAQRLQAMIGQSAE
jgi:uncharacterized protein YecE (DUF72 family)